MLDARNVAVLQNILYREGRSLLQYVHDAFPWTSAGEGPALAQLQKVIEDECRGAAELGRFLHRQRAPLPSLGSYPSGFTTINYTSLDHLLPLLIRHQNDAIEELEHDLKGLTDATARAQADRILEAKRRHLQTLKSLAAVLPIAGVS